MIVKVELPSCPCRVAVMSSADGALAMPAPPHVLHRLRPGERTAYFHLRETASGWDLGERAEGQAW